MLNLKKLNKNQIFVLVFSAIGCMGLGALLYVNTLGLVEQEGDLGYVKNKLKNLYSKNSIIKGYNTFIKDCKRFFEENNRSPRFALDKPLLEIEEIQMKYSIFWKIVHVNIFFKNISDISIEELLVKILFFDKNREPIGYEGDVKLTPINPGESNVFTVSYFFNPLIEHIDLKIGSNKLICTINNENYLEVMPYKLSDDYKTMIIFE